MYINVAFPHERWKVCIKSVLYLLSAIGYNIHSLTPSPFSPLSLFLLLCHHYTFLITSLMSPFFHFVFTMPHPLSIKITLLSLTTLSSFSRLDYLTSPPPTHTRTPSAGCKMDSPQSEPSGEGQKAEENRAQGELQRGRRHSTLIPLSTFPQLCSFPSFLKNFSSPSGFWLIIN